VFGVKKTARKMKPKIRGGGMRMSKRLSRKRSATNVGTMKEA
jgi:hypothetical protein